MAHVVQRSGDNINKFRAFDFVTRVGMSYKDREGRPGYTGD